MQRAINKPELLGMSTFIWIFKIRIRILFCKALKWGTFLYRLLSILFSKNLWTQLLLSSLDFWSNDGFPIMCPSNYWFCHALHLKRTHCILHISNKFQFGRVLWKTLEHGNEAWGKRRSIRLGDLKFLWMVWFGHFDPLYQCIILTVNKRYLAKAIHEHWT